MYLRGIPCNPTQCSGIKVRFVPINTVQNLADCIPACITVPNTTGNHRLKPVTIPYTAPILST